MRKVSSNQTLMFTNTIIKAYNNKFLNHLNNIASENIPYDNYDFETDNPFEIPGRIEIVIDGVSAYIDITSDVLYAIYNIVDIRTNEIENKYMEDFNSVDLRAYNK